ncbi:putative membrane protein [Leptospira ellinghausenii]|uniref:Putative membrane protein n=1 Tax=Leptospira ellinghausenii TaxID=1917822 RepID=A0A2P2DHQ8_9LEPT|nr:putative membrane protein [Leptospira ellinghausenii]
MYLPIDAYETYRDSFLGLFFLILVYPGLVYTSFRMTKSLFWSGLFSSLIFILTIQTVEVPAYSLSSMLETQSMFFLLLSVYAIYRLYDTDNRELEIDGTTKWMIFVSLFGFYFTKYPYGILFFMACFAYELIRSPGKYKEVILYLLKHYAKGIRLLYLVFVVLMVFSLPVLRVVTKINLNQKGFKQFMFGITLVLFVDLSVYLFRNRDAMKKIFPKTAVVLWAYAIFPAFLWLFLNPDRVNALIDAQMIVNAYTRSFFLTLWTEPGKDPSVPGVFDFIWGFRTLVLFSTLSLLYFLVRTKETIWNKIKDPLVAGTFILFLELLILELTTGNKQPRHVLQFIPAIGLVGFLWILRLYHLADHNFQRITSISVILLTTSFVFYNSVYEQGILSGKFYKTKMFCYRGMNAGDFQPAREIAEHVTPNKKYILINAFHFTEKYDTKGRVLASDFDLAMKLRTYKEGMVRNDNKYRWKDWTNFDSVLLLSDICPDSFVEEKFENRTKMLNSKSTLLSTYRESSGTACLQEYKLLQ